MENRSCTDVIFLILFIAYIIGMVSIKFHPLTRTYIGHVAYIRKLLAHTPMKAIQISISNQKTSSIQSISSQSMSNDKKYQD